MKPGILTDPLTGDPIVPTIVYAHHYTVFRSFRDCCRMSALSRNLYFLSVNARYYGHLGHFTDSANSYSYQHYPLIDELSLRNKCWAHVAFVGTRPDPPPDITDSWTVLERLRLSGQLTRAFCYQEPAEAAPNFTDRGRDWL